MSRVMIPADLNYKMSPHFKLGEYLKSQTAARNGIDNTPNIEQFKNLEALSIEVMEPVRELAGVPLIVTSGLRVLELNRAIGSWDGSQHTKGEAADFEPMGVDDLEALWLKIVLGDSIPFDQCILEFPPSGWIHISHVRGGPQRGRITIARKVNGKTRYEHYTRDQIANGEYETKST